jgi:NhaC family Na+:H+ antiporter
LITAAVLVLLVMMVLAAVFHVFLGLPLLLGVGLFALCAKLEGCAPRDVGAMLADGLRKGWIVVQILLIIGLLTASWISCGAIPYLVRLGALLIRPHVFLLCTFWLCVAMSFLLGTSFGTANTIGIVLITIARAGGVSIPITAGAILGGIYFGDRCSPMSSSLYLLNTLCETDLYDVMRMGLRDSMLPCLLASGGYLLCSQLDPLSASASGELPGLLADQFSLTPLVLLPVAVVFLFCLAKKPVKWGMAASILAACALAVAVQGTPPLTLLETLVTGFSLPEGNPLSGIVHGGGLASMWKSCVIVTASCAIGGFAEGLHLTDRFAGGNTGDHRLTIYLKTLVSGFVTAAIGCNQTIAIVLTHAIRQRSYDALGSRALAEDLTFAGSLAPVLIPWCIASYTPLTQLGVQGHSWMLYAFWLWLMLIWQGVRCCLRAPRLQKTDLS